MTTQQSDQKVKNSQNKTVNILLGNLIKHYKFPAYKLIKFLQKEGYSLKEIADAIGISKQAVQQQYLSKLENRTASNSSV